MGCDAKQGQTSAWSTSLPQDPRRVTVNQQWSLATIRLPYHATGLLERKVPLSMAKSPVSVNDRRQRG